jgi:hypothetical protein
MFSVSLTYPITNISNQLSVVVQLVNEEGCLLKGDPWPCLLDGLSGSEGRALRDMIVLCVIGMYCTYILYTYICTYAASVIVGVKRTLTIIEG